MSKIEGLANQLIKVVNREKYSKKIYDYFQRNFGNTDIDIDGPKSLSEDWIIYNLGDNHVRQSLSEGTILYRSNEKTDMSEVINDGEVRMELTCSFPGDVSYCYFSKQIWTGEYAIDETYEPDKGKIVATVYTRDELIRLLNGLSSDVSFDGCFSRIANGYLNEYGSPVMAHETIVVTKSNAAGDRTIKATIIKGNNKDDRESNRDIKGSSLYDAYYDFMIEKGYFSGDWQNVRGQRRNKG